MKVNFYKIVEDKKVELIAEPINYSGYGVKEITHENTEIIEVYQGLYRNGEIINGTYKQINPTKMNQLNSDLSKASKKIELNAKDGIRVYEKNRFPNGGDSSILIKFMAHCKEFAEVEYIGGFKNNLPYDELGKLIIRMIDYRPIEVGIYNIHTKKRDYDSYYHPSIKRKMMIGNFVNFDSLVCINNIHEKKYNEYYDCVDTIKFQPVGDNLMLKWDLDLINKLKWYIWNAYK